MKNFSISFITILFVSFSTSDECIKCVQREKCQEFGNLNSREQKAWVLKYPCSVPSGQEYGTIFRFAAAAKGDYVCCPTAVVVFDYGQNAGVHTGYNINNNNNLRNQNGFGNRNGEMNAGFNPNVPIDDTNNWVPDKTVNHPNSYNNGVDYQNVVGGIQGFNNNGYINQRPEIPPPSYGYQYANPPKNYIPTNYNPYVTSSPLFPGGNYFGNTGLGGKCALTSFPVKPETGCCGREASDTDRITGGRETELEQFPWTALLRTTFDYGNKRAIFDCGGSLISSRYVLTAGHCVFDNDGNIFKVQVFLAEYDKRTFPKDCKLVLGQGEKCIENVVIEGEDVLLHPEYDDFQLSNDIALIRLRENAPYTNYIRPICLPSINVDTPNFMNIRLAAAGWGRNKRNRSDIKQSTIVNLVPQEKCKVFYPGLSRGQVCAAGYNGEDTCKGDSGGPLMTVYGGKYEVVGVVSGKRADSPCGTAVPSLYTNVYHYLDWIHSNIRN